MEKCDIGKSLNIHCHKTGFSRKQGFVQFKDLPCEKQEEIVWRANLKEKYSSIRIICCYHEQFYGKYFERKITKGGHDLKEAIKRMVSSLMENDVVKYLNWSGLGENEKKPFRDLKCRKVLERALQRNPPTKGVSESDVQKAVVHYLAGAADRNGGRKQRAI